MANSLDILVDGGGASSADATVVGVSEPIYPGIGGGNDDVFIENSQIVTTNYTISSGKNAGTFGPVTINSGVTVTVPSGSVWTIV